MIIEAKNIADWADFNFVTKEEGIKDDPSFDGGTVLMYKHTPHQVIIEITNNIELMASIITHETIHCVLFELFYPNGGELSLFFDNSFASAITKLEERRGEQQ